MDSFEELPPTTIAELDLSFQFLSFEGILNESSMLVLSSSLAKTVFYSRWKQEFFEAHSFRYLYIKKSQRNQFYL